MNRPTLGIINAYHAVGADGNEPFAIGAERDHLDKGIVAENVVLDLGRGDIVDPEVFVRASSRQQFAVGAEGEAVKILAMSIQGLEQLAGGGIPELDVDTFEIGGSDGFAVGMEGDGFDGSGVAGVLADLASVVGVPDADDAILAGGCQTATIGTEGQGLHRTIEAQPAVAEDARDVRRQMRRHGRQIPARPAKTRARLDQPPSRQGVRALLGQLGRLLVPFRREYRGQSFLVGGGAFLLISRLELSYLLDSELAWRLRRRDRQQREQGQAQETDVNASRPMREREKGMVRGRHGRQGSRNLLRRKNNGARCVLSIRDEMCGRQARIAAAVLGERLRAAEQAGQTTRTSDTISRIPSPQ